MSNSINLKLVATVIIRLEKNGYRNKLLYPELIGENNFKSPQQQITLTEAGLLIKDVERVMNQILSSI
ncbi:MAG: hypothetical protein AAFO04_03080 [Cyanobacteria bacterium J06592_8]